MAHELATTDNRPSMMYTGEVPWHRLGTRLDEPATASEAIEAAGLDFEVELTRLVTINDIPVPDKLAVVRDDSHTILRGKHLPPCAEPRVFRIPGCHRGVVLKHSGRFILYRAVHCLLSIKNRGDCWCNRLLSDSPWNKKRENVFDQSHMLARVLSSNLSENVRESVENHSKTCKVWKSQRSCFASTS